MRVKIKRLHPDAKMPTLEDMHKAESECDGELFLYPVDTQGTLGGFYLLHVPVKGKIAPTLFPTEYFVKQQEEDE